jgi:hypothetical protein
MQELALLVGLDLVVAFDVSAFDLDLGILERLPVFALDLAFDLGRLRDRGACKEEQGNSQAGQFPEE